MDVPKIVGTLELQSEKGRSVMRLWAHVADPNGPAGELWMPVLAAMFSETFRLTGIEKASSGVWVHQAWYCEVARSVMSDEYRAMQESRRTASPNKSISNKS